LKYLHYAEENGVPKLEVEEAARQMLSLIGDDFPVGNKKALLERFRELEIE
jgi:hypothetical protein